MDKKLNWDWLPAFMPGVARQMKDKRREWGDRHVNECWKRGVVQREPGWFFAAEGALTVGAPFPDPDLQAQLLPVYTATQSLLIMRTPGVAHGA